MTQLASSITRLLGDAPALPESSPTQLSSVRRSGRHRLALAQALLWLWRVGGRSVAAGRGRLSLCITGSGACGLQSLQLIGSGVVAPRR